MLLSEQKPIEEILGYLNGDKSVFLVGCNGCAEASGTGGPREVAEMSAKLEEAGKKVTGSTVVDFLCQKALVKSKLRPKKEQLDAADSILVMITLTEAFSQKMSAFVFKTSIFSGFSMTPPPVSIMVLSRRDN